MFWWTVAYNAGFWAIRAVAVASATLEEVTDVLPGSLSGVEAGMAFVLEVWAQSTDATGSGLACVFVDVEFEPTTMAATGAPTAGSLVETFAQGRVDNESGRLDNLGGCIEVGTEARVGLAPGWVRVASTPMVMLSEPAPGEAIRVTDSGTPGLGVSLLGAGLVSPGAVDFGRLALRTAIPGDLDQDGDVDLADFLAFTRCFSGPGLTAEEACRRADLDGDSDVDLADLIQFQAHLNGSQ